MKFYYSNNGITVKLVRDIRNKNPENECPLRWRVTYKRDSDYYSTGKVLDREDWELFEASEEADFNFKTKAAHLREHKDDIQKYFDDILKPAVKEITDNFSFAALDHKLGKSDILTVNDAFTAKINTLNNTFKVGNATIYRTTLNALIRFQYYRKIKSKIAKQLFIEECVSKKHKTKGKDVLNVIADIKFDDITVKFLSDCEDFWSATGIEYATIGIYMRTLRAIINNGEDPYLSGTRYPFGEGKNKYSIPEGGRKSIALDIEDIWKIEDFETDNQGLMVARDIFIFMFYCNGLNFGDLCRLQYKDIDGASQEIVFHRKKTRDTKKKKNPEPICAPLLPPMVEIINRHGNKEQNGYIFPFLNGIERVDQNERKIKDAIQLALNPINNSLKVIAAQLGIDRNLSTAYTRNSYVTHLTSEMYISEIFVKQMVGHSTGKNVTAGYNNPSPKKRREVNSKLLNPNKKYNTISLLSVTG